MNLTINRRKTYTSGSQVTDLFNRSNKGNCAACHPSSSDDPATSPLFTDFSYDNLGVPANPASPFLNQDPQFNPDGSSFVGLGIGGVLGDAAEYGKFKVPTLRNIAVTAPYMHNGIFTTLEHVVHFYNTRVQMALCRKSPTMSTWMSWATWA